MTGTATAEQLVASLTAALNEAEAAAMAYVNPAGGLTHRHASSHGGWNDGGWWEHNHLGGGTPHGHDPVTHAQVPLAAPAASDPARELRSVAAHREIVDRYAETLRDYARTLERARGGPVANADLDDYEAELPVLRSVVEIIAGIYEIPAG